MNTQPKENDYECDISEDEVMMAVRPRRLSNLGIDFLDDPDMRPTMDLGEYHANHAESFHGDKEHRSEDLDARMKK